MKSSIILLFATCFILTSLTYGQEELPLEPIPLPAPEATAAQPDSANSPVVTPAAPTSYANDTAAGTALDGPFFPGETTVIDEPPLQPIEVDEPVNTAPSYPPQTQVPNGTIIGEQVVQPAPYYVQPQPAPNVYHHSAPGVSVTVYRTVPAARPGVIVAPTRYVVPVAPYLPHRIGLPPFGPGFGHFPMSPRRHIRSRMRAMMW